MYLHNIYMYVYICMYVCICVYNQDVGVLNSGPKQIQCVEDDEFMAAFDKMLTEVRRKNYKESSHFIIIAYTLVLFLLTITKTKTPFSKAL